MIRDCKVQRTLALVHRADVADDLRAVLTPTGRGRRSGLSVEAFLVGLLLAAADGPMTMAQVVNILTVEITVEAQELLGLPGASSHLSRYRRSWLTRRAVENTLSQLAARLAHLPTTYPDLTAKDREHRAGLLQSIMDRLVEAAKPYDLPPTGQYALDATGVWAWGRYRKDSDGTDLDAHWGYKTPKNGDKELFYGYDVYAMTRVQPVDDHTPYPHLVDRVTVCPAGSDEPEATLPMIRQMMADGYRIDVLLTDRAWSYKVPERWALPIRARHRAGRRPARQRPRGPRPQRNAHHRGLAALPEDARRASGPPPARQPQTARRHRPR
jgi:hypothetical protein